MNMQPFSIEAFRTTYARRSSKNEASSMMYVPTVGLSRMTCSRPNESRMRAMFSPQRT